MKKIFLISHPEVFHENNIFNNINNYFEGWYFKCSSNFMSFSFIPGINVCNGKKSAFIQVITNNNSYYIPYSFEDFSYSISPFYVRLSKNYFSLNKIEIDINQKNLHLSGILNFSEILNIKKTFFSPNIMGPFSYIPFMECNHAILSMKHKVAGNLRFNNNLINLDDSTGYCEKDFGTSFPKSYIWCQANCFKQNNCSVFLSIANIPFKSIHFTGFICVLNINGTEYKFTTYNCSSIKNFVINNKSIAVTLKRGPYKLCIKSNMKNSFILKSPKCGEMKNPILESIDSTVFITLYKNKSCIFSDISKNAGLEIVK